MLAVERANYEGQRTTDAESECQFWIARNLTGGYQPVKEAGKERKEQRGG
jgi:hypothetical protein